MNNYSLFFQGRANTFVTVHINHYLPVHVVQYYDADNFYTENVGTEVLGVSHLHNF